MTLSLQRRLRVDPSAIQKLRTTVRGAVLCPGQDGYDAARTIPNAMIDRRPAAIARCTGAADVIAACVSPVSMICLYLSAAEGIALRGSPFAMMAS
jgi:hypothetical protein